MSGRIGISFPDVDANKSPNNPNKPVHFIIERPFLIPSFASLSRVKPRIYRLRNPWREFYEARIYRKSGARYERSSSQIPNSHARIFMERRESCLRYICIVYQRPLL